LRVRLQQGFLASVANAQPLARLRIERRCCTFGISRAGAHGSAREERTAASRHTDAPHRGAAWQQEGTPISDIHAPQNAASC